MRIGMPMYANIVLVTNRLAVTGGANTTKCLDCVIRVCLEGSQLLSRHIHSCCENVSDSGFWKSMLSDVVIHVPGNRFD